MHVSTSLRLSARDTGSIDGADSALNPMMVPTADPDLRGGSVVDAGFGVNLIAQNGPLAGHRLAVEYSVPVHQDLDGPQLEND